MRLDLAGAHQHHLLVHLVIHLEQVEFGDATGMEALTAEDRWLLPLPCFFQPGLYLAFDAFFSLHGVRRRVC